MGNEDEVILALVRRDRAVVNVSLPSSCDHFHLTRVSGSIGMNLEVLLINEVLIRQLINDRLTFFPQVRRALILQLIRRWTLWILALGPFLLDLLAESSLASCWHRLLSDLGQLLVASVLQWLRVVLGRLDVVH